MHNKDREYGLARLSSAVTRDRHDYLDCLEAEYGIRIEARDLSGSLHENVGLYQAEFDAVVLDFYDVVDGIERIAFEACDAIEERNAADADESVEELLKEARGRIRQEGGKLTRRLNSLNLRFTRCPRHFRPRAF